MEFLNLLNLVICLILFNAVDLSEKKNTHPEGDIKFNLKSTDL